MAGLSMPPKVRADLSYTGSLKGSVPNPGDTRSPAPQSTAAALCIRCIPFPYPPHGVSSPLLQGNVEMSTEVAMHQ